VSPDESSRVFFGRPRNRPASHRQWGAVRCNLAESCVSEFDRRNVPLDRCWFFQLSTKKTPSRCQRNSHALVELGGASLTASDLRPAHSDPPSLSDHESNRPDDALDLASLHRSAPKQFAPSVISLLATCKKTPTSGSGANGVELLFFFFFFGKQKKKKKKNGVLFLLCSPSPERCGEVHIGLRK